MIQLHEFQSTIVDKVSALFRAGTRRVLVQLPTGGGKTTLTSSIVHRTNLKGNDAMFSVHRRELVDQVCRRFEAEGIDYGVIAADYPVNLKPLAQVVSVPTLARRLERVKPPKLLVIDECHHAASASYVAIQEWAKDSFVLGLSATPRRLDGMGLRPYFDEIVTGPSMKWLIEHKYLSPYRIFSPPPPNMDGVKIIGGDFNKKQAAERVTDAKIVGDAVAHYRQHCDGARSVAFCVSVEHARQVSEQFQQAGVPSTYFEGNTEDSLRSQIVRDFENGHIKVLANCELLGEGYDLPAIEAVQLLRPTMSLTLYLQQIGRALRYVEGKTATILDHVGNLARHGRPDDDREWTLDVGGKRKEKSKASARVCTRCFASSPARMTECRECGNSFDSEARVIKTSDGELAEYETTATPSPEELAKKDARNEQFRARTLDELKQLGRRRYGEEKGERWAEHIYKAREKKQAASRGP